MLNTFMFINLPNIFTQCKNRKKKLYYLWFPFFLPLFASLLFFQHTKKVVCYAKHDFALILYNTFKYFFFFVYTFLRICTALSAATVSSTTSYQIRFALLLLLGFLCDNFLCVFCFVMLHTFLVQFTLKRRFKSGQTRRVKKEAIWYEDRPDNNSATGLTEFGMWRSGNSSTCLIAKKYLFLFL